MCILEELEKEDRAFYELKLKALEEILRKDHPWKRKTLSFREASQAMIKYAEDIEKVLHYYGE